MKQICPRAQLYPYRSLIAAGLRPPGNSDTAGTQAFATNPWHGISLMQRRVNKHGTPFSRDEAVDVMTGFAPTPRTGRMSGSRSGQGLARGRQARRIAVFADDPFELDLERLPNLEGDLTIAGGRVLHDRAAVDPRAAV